jgi:hypothetical protein
MPRIDVRSKNIHYFMAALLMIIPATFNSSATSILERKINNVFSETVATPKIDNVQTKKPIDNVIVRTVKHKPVADKVKVILSSEQLAVLKKSLSIGRKIGVGKYLAGVTFQESSLGLETVSYNHYGVGSVGYSAYQTVIKRHPWLKVYFKGKNWATCLIKNPKVSLWVSGYYLKYCFDVTKNWDAALSMYRYGYGKSGNYYHRIDHRINQINTLV